MLIDKPATIHFIEAGSITTTSATIAAITVQASNVRITDALLIGTGGSTMSSGDGIRSTGTLAAPVLGLYVERPRISEFSRYGVVLEHVHGFAISDVDIRRCAYAGIMLLSAVNGRVHGGLIKDILQPSGNNSYGVAVSRKSPESITGDGPRSRNITVENVTIDGVPNWEALDTHAGENITFQNNTIYNARVGIAVIGSKDESGSGTAYGPIGCKVLGNVINSGKTDGTAGIGIIFAGAADDLGAPDELATGCVAGNIISNYGTQGTATSSSIQVYASAGVSITDNTIINSGFSGIDFYHDNYGAKASGNTIVDVWTDTASSCYAIQLRSFYNRVSISGTTIVRMSKTATKVNDRGLNISASTTNLVRDGGGNDWAAATTLATAGDALTSESRNYAKKVGLYGVAPVTRAPAVASPSTDPASLKTAVDAIRAALAGIGVTG